MLKQAAFFSILFVVALIAFVSLERSASPFFQACVSGNEQGQHDPVARAVPPALASAIGNYVSCSGLFIERHGGGINALAGLVIAAFTGTLWFATNKQADLTKEAFRAGRRAFIVVPNFYQAYERDSSTGGFNWRFKPILRNIGPTPTRALTMYVQCEIRNTELPRGYKFEYSEADTATGVFPPNSELFGGQAPRTPYAAVTPQDIIDAQNGKKYIYLWGWVKYRDVFPGTRVRTTRYCFLITPSGDPLTFVPNTPGNPPTPGVLTFPFIHHREGNHIDV